MNAFRALSDALVFVLQPAIAALPPLEQAQARAALADLSTATDGLDEGVDDFFCHALGTVIVTAEQVARQVLGATATLADLVVTVLRTQLPVVHTLLAGLGVLTEPIADKVEVDWEKLRDFLSDPARLVSEEEWDSHFDGHGHQLAALLGLLILAPKTIPALSSGDLKAADLPVPPTDAAGPWRTFRETTAGWVSITYPLGDAEDFLWQSGFEDLPTVTLAIRSERRSAGTLGRRTDFEMWLAFSRNSDVWEKKDESGRFARVEPGVTSGVAFDGTHGEWHGRVVPSSAGQLSKPVGADDKVTISFGREHPKDAPAPDLVIGPPYDTRLVVQDIGFGIEVQKAHPMVTLGLTVHGFAVVLTNRWFRSLGATNTKFREGLRFDLDLDVALVEGRGLLLNLESGLRTTYFVEKKEEDKKSKFQIHSVTVALAVRGTQDTFDVRTEVTFHASVEIGPVVLVMDGAGGWVGWWADPGVTDKNCIGLLPPTGIGVDVRKPEYGVEMGGFLDFTGGPDDRFAGVLHGRFLKIEILAFGLYQLTGRAGTADRSASLVIVLGVRFHPAIPLGSGFRLVGVGGLVAINRRVNTDALRERLTAGGTGNVLFCEDPVRNAPALLGDLDALFPAAEGTHVFGPTVRLHWLEVEGHEFITVDLGLFIQLPGPSKIVVLGSARAEVKRAGINLLQLRLDVVGFVDFNAKKIELDATLISSRALGIFRLTGDAAVRIGWDDPPVMLLTLGGFHPDFDPAPAVVPKLTRLALTLDTGAKKPKLELRGEFYFAVTTNTLQVGGKLEATIKSGNWGIHGFISLDAIIQFSPLWFEVSVSVGVSVRWKSHNLVGVKLTGTISGPGPFTVTGKVCIEILFFDICWSEKFVLGDGSPPAPPVAVSVAQELRQELLAPTNLATTGVEDRHVLAGPPQEATLLPLMSPIGSLVWTQKRVPFGLLLERLDGEPLSRRQSVVVTAPVASVPVQDWFSPGSFSNLSVAEALNRRTFERLDAGLALTFGPAGSETVQHEISMIEIRIPRPPHRGLPPFVLPEVVLAATWERTSPAQVRTRAPRFTVREEQYAVRRPDGSVVESGRSRADAFQRARLAGAVAVPAADLVDVGVS